MLIEFEKTVAAHATPERLWATNVQTERVNTMVIQAKPGNTGTVRIRAAATNPQTGLGIQLGIPSTVTATPSAITVSSGEDVNEINMYQYFIEVSIDGDGVNVLAERT